MARPLPEDADINRKLTAPDGRGRRCYRSPIGWIQPTIILLASLLLGGCVAPRVPVMPDGTPIRWTAIDSLNSRLPASVRVFEMQDAAMPLRAWYAAVDVQSAPARVVLAGDTTDNRASVADIASAEDACLAVNGGYFTMNETPARHVGLLALSDSIYAFPTEHDLDPQSRLGRAALLFDSASSPAVAWVGRADTTLVAHRPENETTHIIGTLRPSSAVGAGPMLLRNGRLSITADEEGFAATSIPAVHPRTAAGVTEDGRLILLVVDGRQDASRGVDLPQLAALLQSAGAVDGLNLDGGGSSTMVVRNLLLNRPTGGTYQREVMSAVVVDCE